MENKSQTWAEQELQKFTLEEKLLAAKAIYPASDIHSKKPEEITENEMVFLDNQIRRHIYANGPMGVKMAAKVGKAIIASEANPLKVRVSLWSLFKAFIKRILS